MGLRCWWWRGGRRALAYGSCSAPRPSRHGDERAEVLQAGDRDAHVVITWRRREVEVVWSCGSSGCG